MGRRISYEKPPATMTYTATGTSLASSKTHTHSGLSFGAADQSRYLVVAIATIVSTTNLSTVTIGGVSASLIARPAVLASTCCELWGALVPTGTSGSVVFTNTNTMGTSVVDVFSLVNLISTTATATSTDLSSPVSTSVVVPDNGFLIAAVSIFDVNNTGPASWSGGVTQVTNTLADSGGGNGSRLTCARYDAAASATISPVLTVSLDFESVGATAAFA